MGAALYIVLEKQIDELDLFVNGKALSQEEEELDAIARDLGVTPLMDFYGTSQEEADEFGLEAGPEPWFTAEQGLATVTALLAHFKDENAVTADLQEFARVLEEARKHQVRWHLGVDY